MMRSLPFASLLPSRLFRRGDYHPDLSLLFDTEWYRAQNPGIRARDALKHFLAYGAAEGRDPNPLFDTDWYLEQYPDVARSRINPLLHYLTQGSAEGRDPCALFDTDWYLAQYPDVAASGMNPLAHYITRGGFEGRDPTPLFDSDWYLEHYADVARSQVNPLIHYLEKGAAEGRDPCALFDTDWYLAQYPDVAAAGINPLVDYVTNGVAKGRDPNPLFDTDWYLAEYPDVARQRTNPLVHYMHYGVAERRDPGPLFNTDWYREQNQSDLRTGVLPLAHYLSVGRSEGRLALSKASRRRNDALRAVSESLNGLFSIEPELRAWIDPGRMSKVSVFAGEVGGRRFTAWKKLFRSLPRAYDQLIFVPSFFPDGPLGPATTALEATGLRLDADTLVVATDRTDDAPPKALPHDLCARVLSEIEPELTPEDRAEIVKLLIYLVRPRITLNAGSNAWWEAVRQWGAALSSNTRLDALIPSEADLTPMDRYFELRHLRSSLRHLTTLYFKSAESREQFIREYGIPTYLQAALVVLGSSHNVAGASLSQSM